MTANFSLPGWLEEYRVPDNTLASAYDNFGSYPRALIKTAIAIARLHFSDNDRWEKTSKYHPDAGFLTYTSIQPMDWTVLIFSQDCSGAALIASAGILPVIGGVPEIIAICLSNTPPASILAPLELCGINDIFCLDYEKTQRLLRDLSCISSNPYQSLHGLAVFLDQNHCIDNLANPPENLSPVIHLRPYPRIFMDEAELLDQNLLRMMLGAHFEQLAYPSLCDVVYVKNDSSVHNFTQFSAPLILTPECAGFWIFQNLSVANFQCKKNAFKISSTNFISEIW